MMRVTIIAAGLALLAGSAAATSGLDCIHAKTQLDMDACAQKDSDAADKQLNEAYRLLMATLDDDGYKAKLKAAERNWMTFRDSECTFEVAEDEGGTIYQMTYTLCITRLTNARTRQLQDYLVCWKDASKCL
jgi:uncharacterized protein YecT (DUF1311 family)